jgi:hypothetical protein
MCILTPIQTYTFAYMLNAIYCVFLFQYFYHNEYEGPFRSKPNVLEFLQYGTVKGKVVNKKVPRYFIFKHIIII